MSTHTATVTVVTDGHDGDLIRVDQADEEIWIADELWRESLDPDRERIRGDMEIDGDMVRFGTEGYGLGRLTYRRVGHDPVHHWHIAVRVDGAAA